MSFPFGGDIPHTDLKCPFCGGKAPWKKSIFDDPATFMFVGKDGDNKDFYSVATMYYCKDGCRRYFLTWGQP